MRFMKLRQALEQVPAPSTKEEKTALKKKRKQLKELEEHRDKLPIGSSLYHEDTNLTDSVCVLDIQENIL